MPLWLEEGLAEYWGNSQIENKEARVGLVDVRQIRYLQQNRLLPIQTLVTLDGTSPLYNTQDHAGLFYAESWLVVHLLSEFGRTARERRVGQIPCRAPDERRSNEAAKQAFGDSKKARRKFGSVRPPAALHRSASG